MATRTRSERRTASSPALKLIDPWTWLTGIFEVALAGWSPFWRAKDVFAPPIASPEKRSAAPMPRR